MTRRALTLPLLVGSIACFSACDETMYVNPAPVLNHTDVGQDAGGDAASSDAPEPIVPTEAGPFRRSVMSRSPFGNLDHTDNLLIDGDMEMSAGAGQTPWVAIGGAGQTGLILETGGRCRSGLRCLVLDRDVDTTLGYGVAAGDQPLEFWLWAKVPGNDCGVATVYLFPRMTMAISMFNTVPPQSPQPDGEGWCRFYAQRSAMDESVGVLVEVRLLDRQRVILDDAVLRAADGLSPTSVRSLPISPAEHARLVSKIAPVLRNRWIGPPMQQPKPISPHGP